MSFISLTDTDGDTVALKADSINAVWQSRPEVNSFFAHANKEPARTVVSAAAGSFTVVETHQEVMRLITGGQS